MVSASSVYFRKINYSTYLPTYLPTYVRRIVPAIVLTMDRDRQTPPFPLTGGG